MNAALLGVAVAATAATAFAGEPLEPTTVIIDRSLSLPDVSLGEVIVPRYIGERDGVIGTDGTKYHMRIFQYDMTGSRMPVTVTPDIPRFRVIDPLEAAPPLGVLLEAVDGYRRNVLGADEQALLPGAANGVATAPWERERVVFDGSVFDLGAEGDR